MGGFFDRTGDDTKAKAQMLLSDIELQIISRAIIQRTRSRMQEVSVPIVPPRVYCALNRTEDELEMAELFRMAAKDLDAESDNMIFRTLTEQGVSLGEDRYEELYSLGEHMGKTEDVMCVYLASEIWSSRECRDLECPPEEAPDRREMFAVQGGTMDGRNTFEAVEVGHEDDGRAVLSGEIETNHDTVCNLLDSFWRGYMTARAKRMGIAKKD